MVKKFPVTTRVSKCSFLSVIWPKAAWGGKCLFVFYFRATVHRWRKSGQELKQRPCRNAACWLIPQVHVQLPFSYLPGPPCPMVAPPIVYWTSHQALIKTVLHRHQSDGDIFSIMVLSSWMTLVYIKLTKQSKYKTTPQKKPYQYNIIL